VTRFIEDSLRLTVNARKSAVDRPWNRKFLGFRVSRNGLRLKVAEKALDKHKDRVRELTRRTRGQRLDDVVAELRETLLGWKAYFGIAAFARAYPVRREAMARAFLTGVYTLQEIADYFGVHYCTLSRALRRLEAGGDCASPHPALLPDA
jgi:transposase